jgi:cation transporter-like permease
VLIRDDWSLVTDVSGDVGASIFRARLSTKSLLGPLDLLLLPHFLLEPCLFIL